MWEDFNTAVRAIDVAALDRAGLGDLAGEIGRTRAVLDGLEARIAAGLRRLGASEASAAETLRRRTGCSTREAKHRTRRAEALRKMPNVADALSSGRLTGEHASALARAAAETSPEAVDRDAGLLVEASSMPADAASSRARDWVRQRQTDDDLERLHQWQRRNRSLLFTAGEGGMIAGIAKFDRVSGAQFQNLVEALADRLYRADGGRDNPHARSRAQCRHDALLTLVGIEPAIPSPGLPSATSSGPRSDSDDSNAGNSAPDGSAPDGHRPVLEAASPGKASPRLSTPRQELLPDLAARPVPGSGLDVGGGTIPAPGPDPSLSPGSGLDVGGGTIPAPDLAARPVPGSGLDVGGGTIPAPDLAARPVPGSGLDVGGGTIPAPGPDPSLSPGSGLDVGGGTIPAPDLAARPVPGSGLDVGGGTIPAPDLAARPVPGSGLDVGGGTIPAPGPDPSLSPGSGLDVGGGTIPAPGPDPSLSPGSSPGLAPGPGVGPSPGSGLEVARGPVPGPSPGLAPGRGRVPGPSPGSGLEVARGSVPGPGSGPSPSPSPGSAGSGGVSEVVRNGRASSNGSGVGSAGSGASEGRGAVPGIVPGRGLDTSGPYPGAGPGCTCGRGFGPKAQLCVVMDVPYLATDGERGRCEIPGVGAIARSELERLGCDSDFYGLLFDQRGLPLYHGRKTRRVSPQQWRVLVARDKGCVICGAHPNWCQAHHVRYWLLGGRTDIDNLVLLCHAHHRWVHDNEIILRHGSNGWYAPTGLPPPGDSSGRSARSLALVR